MATLEWGERDFREHRRGESIFEVDKGAGGGEKFWCRMSRSNRIPPGTLSKEGLKKGKSGKKTHNIACKIRNREGPQSGPGLLVISAIRLGGIILEKTTFLG